MDLTNVPAQIRPALIAANANKPLAGIDKAQLANECIERYLDGTTIQAIADEYKVTRPRLYQLLAEHGETSWKSAQAAHALHEYEIAEQDMRGATDGLSVVKAREQVKSAQWKLERVLRRIYGQDAPQVNIQINLGEIRDQIKALEQDLRIGEQHTRHEEQQETEQEEQIEQDQIERSPSAD